MSNELVKIPTLQELVQESEIDLKNNAFQVLLNQHPPKEWIKKNNGVEYLPIGRQEYLLTRIYTRWWVEIKEVKQIANSVNCVVRLFVINPVTKETEWQDGTGAQPMQTDKGATAAELDAIKNNAVQLASPASESYAISDAAHKFGKIFGKDLGRKEQIDYNSLLKKSIEFEDLKELYDELDSLLLITPEMDIDCKRILDNKEKNSYQKLYNQLIKLKPKE